MARRMSAFSHNRTLALPAAVDHWSLTTLREKLINIGTQVVRHGRYLTFQMAEVAMIEVSRAYRLGRGLYMFS